VIAHGAQPPRIPDDPSETNVHVPDHELIGRADAVTLIQHLLERYRLVTITGAGGTGKTRLAVEVLLRTREFFRDGVWLVDLINVAAPGGVLAPMISTIGGAGATSLDSLAERQALMLVDNCEHVLDDAAAAVTALLRAAPEVKVLATSRQPLSLGPEAVFPLAPLPVPPTVATLREESQYASYQLFVQRAQLLNPSFRVDDAESEALVRCLNLLDGMPLGIEIAASQTRAMSLRRLADTLAGDVPGLRTGRRDVTDRHRSVEATIQWSVDLLASGPETGDIFSHRCSGSLISPTLIVTAGHCTEGVETGRVYFQQSVAPNYDPDAFGGLAVTRRPATRTSTASRSATPGRSATSSPDTRRSTTPRTSGWSSWTRRTTHRPGSSGPTRSGSDRRLPGEQQLQASAAVPHERLRPQRQGAGDGFVPRATHGTRLPRRGRQRAHRLQPEDQLQRGEGQGRLVQR
jgi:Trypsin